MKTTLCDFSIRQIESISGARILNGKKRIACVNAEKVMKSTWNVADADHYTVRLQMTSGGYRTEHGQAIRTEFMVRTIFITRNLHL